MPLINRVMPKPSNSPLRPNPFQAYRNPTTGEWLVIENATENAAIASSREGKASDLPSSLKLKTPAIHRCDRDRTHNKAKSIASTLAQYR
ncbi:MAG: hypothetical protein J7647_32880 [Cyanobacteria bacterium SBLK]|nr:hypothetical protein [Cyanobacteria bacterium SBLK]